MIPFDPDLSFKPGIQVIQLFVPSKIIYHPAKEMQKEKITNNLFFATIGIVLSLLKSLKKYIILPGLTPPPPFPEGTPTLFLGTPFFFKQVKSYPLFLRAIQIGACKMYKTAWNEGFKFLTILSQLRILLSLLFILSSSTLYLLLTLALVRYYL